MGEFNVNKSDGSLEQTAGMPDTYPAQQVMMSDGVTSVEDAVDEVKSELGSLIKTGFFKVACTAGQNLFSRSTVTVLNGSLPPDFTKAICMVVAHSTVRNSPNTIEADDANTFIIHSVSAQNISVRWIDLS